MSCQKTQNIYNKLYKMKHNFDRFHLFYILEDIFLDPFQDPLGSGFQAIQTLYAIGPGGLLGVGFDHSIQKHFYLPEPQTNFFAIIAEEYGFIGGVTLIGVYFTLFKTVLKVSQDVKDIFGSLLMIGIISMVGIQTLINLGVVVGLGVTGQL